MIVKSYKDADYEIVIQQGENGLTSVSFFKNDVAVEFHSNLYMDDALELFDFFLDKCKGNDLKDWGIG